MNEWPTVALRHVARLEYGDALPGDARVDGDVPVVGSGGTDSTHNHANSGPGPAIVVGRKGSAGSVRWFDEPVHVIDTAYWVRTGSRIDSRFLYYVLSVQRWSETTQDVGVPGLSRDLAHATKVPIPPLDEQRRIADFLDTETTRLDSLLDERARQTELLSERRTAILVDVVGAAGHGPRRAAGLGWLPSVPEGWAIVELTLLAHLGSGHTPSRSKPEWWADPTTPWITTGEVAQLRDDRLETIIETREMISELGLANSSAEVHPRGTVVLSRTASVGYSAVMGREMATSQDFATWTCGPRLDPYYLLWTLRAMRPWLIGARAMGSTHKTIYMPDIQSLRVPLPPIEEQRSIVASVRSALARIDQIHDALAAQQSLLAERRQALITAAVTGRLDVATARGVTS